MGDARARGFAEVGPVEPVAVAAPAHTAPGSSTSAHCVVCGAAAPAYTCPRCLSRYCRAACYQAHSSACAEAFASDAATAALRNERVEQSGEAAAAVAQALRRVNLSEAAEARQADSDDESDDAEGEGGGSGEGAALEPEALERNAAVRAVAAAAASPWWTLPEASEGGALGEAGNALVTEVQGGGEVEMERVAEASGAGVEHAGLRLPPLPQAPLPRVVALTSRQAAPAAQRAHCVALLAAYAAAWRLYGGCCGDDPLGAAAVVAACAPEGLLGSAAAAGSAPPPPMTAAAAAAAAVERTAAAQRAEGAPRAAAAVAGRLAAADARALCWAGRAACVRALCDLARVLEAARGAGRAVKLGARKARFFASWANESADALALAAAEVEAFLASTASSQEAAAAAKKAAVQAAQPLQGGKLQILQQG